MAARYTPVTLADFTALLLASKGWKPVSPRGCKEHVFDFEIGGAYPGIVVRVYTSVSLNDDAGRGCGEDAIRVCGVDTVYDKGVVKKARVHRTQNWRDNLKARILEAIEAARKNMANRVRFGEWKRPVSKFKVTLKVAPGQTRGLMSGKTEENWTFDTRGEADSWLTKMLQAHGGLSIPLDMPACGVQRVYVPAPSVPVGNSFASASPADAAVQSNFRASQRREVAPVVHEATRRADSFGGRDEDEFTDGFYGSEE